MYDLQVINLCWCHGLYDAIIYVYTQGMADYITPLEQLLWQLGVAVSRGKQLTGECYGVGAVTLW